MQLRSVRFIFFVLLFFFKTTPNSFALGIDFTEKANFNEDGSGQFSIEVGLAKTSNLISIIKYLNKDYKDITKAIGYIAFNNARKQFKKIPDITQVRVQYNEALLTFKLSFTFNHIKALNKAIRKINKGLDPPKITYFGLDDGLFVREDINGIVKKLLFYQKYDDSLVKSLDLASFFKETTYTTVYTFERRRIKNFSNPLTIVSKDQQQICITHHIFAPDQIEHSIGNRVHFLENSF